MAARKTNDPKARERAARETKNLLTAKRVPTNPCYAAMAAQVAPEDGMVAISKPRVMFLGEACGALVAGGIQFEVRAGKQRSVSRLIKHTTITLYVPAHLRGRAEWLFSEWVSAGEYLRQVG